MHRYATQLPDSRIPTPDFSVSASTYIYICVSDSYMHFHKSVTAVIRNVSSSYMCFFLRFGTPNALGEKENGNENEKEKRDAECVVFLDRLRSARLLIFPSRSSGSFGIGICGVNFPHFLGNQSMPRQRQFVVVLLSNCIQV